MKQWVALPCAARALDACASLDPPAIHLDRPDIAQRACVDRV